MTYLLILGACKIEKIDKVIFSFTQELTGEHPNYDKIIDNHLCKLPKDDTARQIVELQLAALRERLVGADYKVYRYEASSNLLIIDQNNDDTVFELTENGKVITYLIMNSKKKIVSFSAMRKGEKLIPMSICR
ncbi:MAG: hypothetical protein EOP00_17110 [Pedobacter sp.]|nr:MAG: hypothetical protein EOP00_17110 [Pedobacter sp.]